jgi:hypothetical protein
MTKMANDEAPRTCRSGPCKGPPLANDDMDGGKRRRALYTHGSRPEGRRKLIDESFHAHRSHGASRRTNKRGNADEDRELVLGEAFKAVRDSRSS